MAEMGPVRKIDDLGRVVIPKEFRKTFNCRKTFNGLCLLW